MSVETFKARWPKNVPGLYYVSDRCIDCGACRALAPGLFQRSDPGQYSYVARQPVSAEELRLAAQSIAACPTNAIHTDGGRFNWSLTPCLVPGE